MLSGLLRIARDNGKAIWAWGFVSGDCWLGYLSPVEGKDPKFFWLPFGPSMVVYMYIHRDCNQEGGRVPVVNFHDVECLFYSRLQFHDVESHVMHFVDQNRLLYQSRYMSASSYSALLDLCPYHHQ